MGNEANVFALLADQESQDALTIIAYNTVKEEKNNEKAKNQKTSSVKGQQGRGQERQSHGETSVSRNDMGNSGNHRNGRLDGSRNGSRYGTNGNVREYKNYWQGKGNARDNGRLYENNRKASGSMLHNGRAGEFIKDGGGHVNIHNYQQDKNRRSNRRARVTEIGADQLFENEGVIISSDAHQKHDEAVKSPGHETTKVSDGDLNLKHAAATSHSGIENDQGHVSAAGIDEVPPKEQTLEQTKRSEEEDETQAERKQRWVAREKQRKEQMKMKTLKEYEKQKADKAALSVPETNMRKATLDKDLESMLVLSKEKIDNIYSKQNSKGNPFRKDNNIDDQGKVHKTMSIEEFRKLTSGSERQGDASRGRGEHFSRRNTNGGGQTGRGGNGLSAHTASTNHGRNGRDIGRSDSKSNANSSPGGIGRGRNGGSQYNRVTEKKVYAEPAENNADKVKAGPVIDITDQTSFPVLGKAAKLRTT